MASQADTICAPASGAGPAGVAVIRVSGALASGLCQVLSGLPPPPPRLATLRLLRDRAGRPLDRALVLWFPAPASYTGEDVLELHCHGGRATVAALLAALCAEPGVRLAGPGEFTRRAVVNGRMDLTAAEGIADLVAAETAAQRAQALALAEGVLGRQVAEWRRRLVRLMALAEAEIDFPDEDLPPDLGAGRSAELAALAGELGDALAGFARARVVREGATVAILGPPNAGKSSLLNALARREAAIVAPEAGTTRDVVEVALDLGGLPVLLADTAGLRERPPSRPGASGEGEGEGDIAAAGAVEVEGMRRALVRAEAADLILFLADPTRPEASAAARARLPTGRPVLWLSGKADLAPPLWPDCLPLSPPAGLGLSALEDALRTHLGAALPEPGLLTRQRHHDAVAEALEALERAATATLPELLADDLRQAARALGRLTGAVDVEELLDLVFAEFCIGK